MHFKFFEEMKLSRVAKVPVAYSKRVRWQPQIGDVVPNFTAETTGGLLGFHDWAEGSWVVLFSHPAAMTSICTTEAASFAAASPEFRKRGVKLLGISRSSIEDHRRWHADIERIYDVKMRIPMIADEEGMLIGLFGMLHAKQSHELAIRKTIIIGPDLRVRMIFEYPMLVGRGTDEMLRVIDALQTVDTYNVATSADWRKGDDCLLLPASHGPARFSYGSSWTKICSYFSTVTDPWLCKPATDVDADPTKPAGQVPRSRRQMRRAATRAVPGIAG